jgi:probable F420-dependent oxidoreductase
MSDDTSDANRASLVTDTRRRLGPVGLHLPAVGESATPSLAQLRDDTVRLERAGYRAVYLGEGIGGKDVFVEAAVLLAATERLIVGTGIANMLAREPETADGAARTLAEAYPHRFVLGVGVGYPFQAAQVGADFSSPLTRARDYLSRMVVEPTSERYDGRYPLFLAANGPKMLALAAELGDGAQPTVVPTAFTTMSRELIGPDKLLVVGQPVVVDDDVDRAREVARTITAAVIGRPDSPYGANLVRLGYAQADITAATDAVVDAVMAYGTPEAIAARVREHLVAGADHVMLTPVVQDFSVGIEQAIAMSSTIHAVTDAR